MDHKITLERNRDKKWIALCSCGRWVSNKYQLRSDAESAGEIHVFKGDNHLRALAQFDRGKTRVNLSSELRWYEEQSENPHLTDNERDLWKMLADELRPRVATNTSDDPGDQLTLWGDQ